MKIEYFKKDPNALLDLVIYHSNEKVSKSVSRKEYHVFVVSISFNEFEELKIWLKEKCNDVYVMNVTHSRYHGVSIIFRTSSDEEAMMFRLSWL